MDAISLFYVMNQQDFRFLNQALVILIPKKANTQKVTDFRPISLIHSFGKIIPKLLANRLAPKLKNLISCNQSTFIKKRYLHHNFMFVHQVIKDLYNKKVPALFLKLDISKAFDTVNWSYLLDIMTFHGFGTRWRNWISAIWASSSSRFLINGEPGRSISHQRGVRQGDSLSPMLFLLAIEPLHMLFRFAHDSGELSFLHGNCASFRMSLYANDAVVFVSPIAHDLIVTRRLLQFFGDASGLITNLDKSEIFPIRCGDINLDVILGGHFKISQFPYVYLGLPLHYKKIPKHMIQPMV
jgi:hypothetical protein